MRYIAVSIVLALPAAAGADVGAPAAAEGAVKLDFAAAPPVHRLDQAAKESSPTSMDDYRLAALQGDVWGPQAGDWEFILSGTGFSNNDFDAHSFGLAASIGHFFNEAFEIGLRQSLGIFDGDDGTEWNGSTRAFLDFHFNLDRFRPFIGASFGYIYGDSVNDTWTAGLEAGLKWYALQRTFIFGMIEYLWFFDSAGDADDTFDDGQFVYTFGIGFNF